MLLKPQERGVAMYSLRWHLLLALIPVAAAFASVPKLAVVPHLIAELYPAEEMITVIETVLDRSGRFEIVQVDASTDSSGPGGNLSYYLRELAASEGIDFFLLVDCSDPLERERTVTGGDTLTTWMTMTVDVSGRFYTSSGALIGAIRETGTAEGFVPLSPDAARIAIRASQNMAERSLLELFPIEVSFIVSSGPLYEIPEGSIAGLRRGMILSLVAKAPDGIPDSPDEYDMLRSRGLLQVTEISQSTGRGRLLAGRLVNGGQVIAVEQGTPALISMEYHAMPSPVEEVENSEQSSPLKKTILMSYVNIGGATCKWGLGFGGSLSTGTSDHVSSVGIRFTAGPRIPLRSPSVALRLSAGGETTFFMQDVRNDSLSSSTATSVAFGAIAKVDLEWLFSDHLGFSAGVTGRLGSRADSWTVQDEQGYTREALPWEIYYSSIEQGIVSARAGLFYIIY
jgi:hypothetical protein